MGSPTSNTLAAYEAHSPLAPFGVPSYTAKGALPTTPAPIQELPTTPAPVHELPTTPAPVQELPTTPAPVQELPTTPSPVQELPSSDVHAAYKIFLIITQQSAFTHPIVATTLSAPSHQRPVAPIPSLPRPSGSNVTGVAPPQSLQHTSNIRVLPFTCLWNHCGRTFPVDSKELLAHIINHSSQGQRSINNKWHCGWKGCTKSYSDKRGLERHITSNVHIYNPVSFKFTCKMCQCSWTRKSKTTLSSHKCAAANRRVDDENPASLEERPAKIRRIK
ncbi:hypothetical protein C0991_008520 [Blastosporella zonata]|nr:hypothetical protein C0991_008520 [Blastosporella zonata]